MRRRELLLASAALAAAPLLRAQPPDRMFRIGFLGAAAPRPDILVNTLDPFRQGMREHGWIEGKQYAIVARWAEGRSERVPEQAAELVRLPVDLLLVAVTSAIREAMRATQSIPIVMVLANDPVRDGLIASFARPGGNVTGMAVDADLGSLIKQVDYLRQMVPRMRRIAVLSNPDARLDTVDAIQAAIPTLGLELVVAHARAPEEIALAFTKLKEAGAQAVLVHPDGMLTLQRSRVCEQALSHRLPLTAIWRVFPQGGALMSYGPDWADNYRRSAGYVVRILGGAKPAELPVERPTKFALAVNLKTARALGVTVPQALLLAADEVIE